MTGVFYKESWDSITEDVYQIVVAFFCGFNLPRFITHTNLKMQPKKLIVNTFSDMRSISLSNFVNKNFSTLIHNRIKRLLPEIISTKQASFFHERSIVENILVVQEISSEIRKRGKSLNMVIKLDMMKAYNRLDSLYLTKVLRKLGFNEAIIDIV